MTRPDGLLLVGAITSAMGVALWSDGHRRYVFGRALLTALAVFAVIYGGYFSWRVMYYGQLWPNTFYVKVGFSSYQIERGVDYVQKTLLVMGLYPLVFGAALRVVLWRGWFRCAEAHSRMMRPASLAAMAGFGLLYLMYLIYIGGDYFGPRLALSVVVVLVMLSADAIVEVAAARRSTPVIAVVIVVLFWIFFFVRTLRAFYPEQSIAGIQPNWNRLGLWLRENAPAESVIAVDAAGAVPYFSRLRAVDMFGLNDLYIAHIDIPNMGSGKAGHEKYDPVYIYRKNPDWIASWIHRNGLPDIGLSLWPEIERYSLYMVIAKDELRPWYHIVDNDTDIQALWDEGYQYGLWKRNERIVPAYREVDLSTMAKRGLWEERWRAIQSFNYLFSHQPGAMLQFDVEGGGMLSLVTICHHWSGMIDVYIADVRYRVDLYASEESSLPQCVYSFDLPNIATERIPVTIEVLPDKNPASASTEVFINRVLIFHERWHSSTARRVQETSEMFD
jgi:hypothetical protein